MTPQEIRFAVNGLTGLVVLSVAAALANLTWRLAGEAGGPSAVGAAVDAFVAPAPAPDVSAMINLPPFGRATAAAAISAAPADLILHGALMANPASASSALIASGGKESISYRIGDPVTGSLILDAIGVDFVVLRSGEQSMTLYFPGDERARQAGAALAGTAPQPGGATATQGLRDPKTLLPAWLTRRGGAPASNPGAALPSIPTVPASPPPQPVAGIGNTSSGNALIDSLGATVTPQGYRVGSTLSPQLKAAGLAPGDIIASVNGISAATLAGDPRRLAQTVASGEARIEVVRGGNRMLVSVPGR